MLFMVIERFRGANPHPIGDRFERHGRMMPEGISYVSSWIDPASAVCYQVMEAPSAAALQPWIDRWSDLVDFELIPVVSSQDYWQQVRQSRK